MADLRSVSLLGLGIMGSRMARNLIAKGFEVTVYNRNPERTREFEGKARIAGSPAEAARGAAAVIVMVSDDNASRALWPELLSNMGRDAVGIESSTVSPAWIRELAARAEGAGIAFLDAPVTGSRQFAEDAQLRFLVGGDAEHLEKVRPVLAAMGNESVYLGPAGSGILMKMVNNFVCGVQAAALAEGLSLAERGGLDLSQVQHILTNGAPASPMVKNLSPRMLARDYEEPNFHAALMAKDLEYARAEAERFGLTLKTAEAARDRFRTAAEEGLGEKDLSAVAEPLRRQHDRGLPERGLRS